MSNTTANYNLTKPLETERYDVQVFNNNADIIDAAMKTNADNISNVKSRLDNLNNWTTVEFSLADFTYDENSGITYLRTEAPSGYEIAEIKGYMVLNKRELDASVNYIVMDVTKPQYVTELVASVFSISLPTDAKSEVLTMMSNIDLELLYIQTMITHVRGSNNKNWSDAPIMNGYATTARSIADSQRFETTSFTLKTNIPYSNILNFYGKLQYRVVPS